VKPECLICSGIGSAEPAYRTFIFIGVFSESGSKGSKFLFSCKLSAVFCGGSADYFRIRRDLSIFACKPKQRDVCGIFSCRCFPPMSRCWYPTACRKPTLRRPSTRWSIWITANSSRAFSTMRCGFC